MSIMSMYLFLYCCLYSNSALKLCLGKLLEHVSMCDTGLWFLFYCCWKLHTHYLLLIFYVITYELQKCTVITEPVHSLFSFHCDFAYWLEVGFFQLLLFIPKVRAGKTLFLNRSVVHWSTHPIRASSSPGCTLLIISLLHINQNVFVTSFLLEFGL